jgi:hypothetical protein
MNAAFNISCVLPRKLNAKDHSTYLMHGDYDGCQTTCGMVRRMLTVAQKAFAR